jgi:hypothetical protein
VEIKLQDFLPSASARNEQFVSHSGHLNPPHPRKMSWYPMNWKPIDLSLNRQSQVDIRNRAILGSREGRSNRELEVTV